MTDDNNESVAITRRALLVGVGVALGGGGSALFARVAEAAAGDGPLEAGRLSVEQMQLRGKTSNPTPSSGYGALLIRSDRV